jgi:hypothetical protein
MGNNDLFTNTVFLLGLGLVSIITYIAIDQKKFGKAAFFGVFGLTILRSLVLRWLAGITDSNFGPNTQLAEFLKSNETTTLIYTILFAALVWFFVEELFEFRDKRKLKKFAVSQLKTIDDKNLEIEDLKTSIEHEHEKGK